MRQRWNIPNHAAILVALSYSLLLFSFREWSNDDCSSWVGMMVAATAAPIPSQSQLRWLQQDQTPPEKNAANIPQTQKEVNVSISIYKISNDITNTSTTLNNSATYHQENNNTGSNSSSINNDHNTNHTNATGATGNNNHTMTSAPTPSPTTASNGTFVPSDEASVPNGTLAPTEEGSGNSSGTMPPSEISTLSTSMNMSMTVIPSTLYPTAWNTRNSLNAAYNALPIPLRDKLRLANSSEVVIPGDYIMVLNTTVVEDIEQIMKRVVTESGITRTATYATVSMVKIQLNEQYGTGTTTDEKYIDLLTPLLKSSLVLFIEEDSATTLDAATSDNSTDDAINMTLLNTPNYDGYSKDQVNPPSWGLDRIDQETLPLDTLYHADFSGYNISVYILDTGILTTHQEFMPNRAVCEHTIFADEACIDMNGHGTFVAGVIAGNQYGVAKEASVIGIKVFKNDGSGTHSGIVDGIDYILQQQQKNPDRKVVINMSYGGSTSRAVDYAVQTMIDDYKILVVASAGNKNGDACQSSPGRLDSVLTVGSTDDNDLRSFFSNYGPCVNIFAPGTDITSAWCTSDTASKTMSGTSMATPHVTGYAALYLQAAEYFDDIANITGDPDTFITQIMDDATNETISDVKDSPNLLLCTEALFQTLPNLALVQSAAASSIISMIPVVTTMTSLWIIASAMTLLI